MPEQETLNDSGEHAGPEPIVETSHTDWNENAKSGFVDITELIRSIQRVEGNPDCFRKGKDNCDEVECAWRQYCLETHKDSNKNRVI
jgi:hypothetical protein